MNKKAQFVAILSLFFILGIIAINYHLVQGTSKVVSMYYTPTDILKQDSEIEEYLFNLNQHVKYSSFKAFDDLCGRDNLISDLRDDKIKENFKNYFINYFSEAHYYDNYDINIEKNENNNFVISGKYNKGKKIFRTRNVIVEVPVEFNYVLDYDISIFDELYVNCMSVFSCDNLKKCPISKNECSSGDNYINIKKVLVNNGFIEPKISFTNKFERIEG